MKNKLFKFRFVMLSIMVILLFNSDLISQTLNSHDSFLRLTKSKAFWISNPAPQYIVEIRNDKTISFYNILPENFTEYQSKSIGSWIVDSTTIILENSDFFELTKTINGIDLENIDKIEKPKSENGVEIFISGGGSDKFTIELTNQKAEFSIDPNNEQYISESAKIVSNLIGELEKKYKPKE